MEIVESNLVASFKSLERLPSDFDAQKETEHLANLASGSLKDALGQYEHVEALGAGGSGVVVSAIYKPFGTRRALKFPRAHIYQEAAGEFGPDDPEIHALSKLSHQNITRLYESFPLGAGRGHCMVTEIVDRGVALHVWVERLLCNSECRRDVLVRTEKMKALSALLSQIVSALQHCHLNADLIHFDVKPDNILVSHAGHPYLNDFGCARDLAKLKSTPEQAIPLGFTWKYAHPRLADPDLGGRVSKSPAKSRNNNLKAKDLGPSFDLFALGRSLQEVLFVIEREYQDNISSDYTYSFLHVIACLCLDGKNASNGHAEAKRRSFVTDTALGMPPAVFHEQKFSSISQVAIAFDRLLGRCRLEETVPELDSWAPESIKATDLGVTTFQGDLTLQSMLFLPKERELYLAAGELPATKGKFRRVEGLFRDADRTTK